VDNATFLCYAAILILKPKRKKKGSTFPDQSLNAVAFSGFACGHWVAVDLGF
jgi:hypothetical protein